MLIPTEFKDVCARFHQDVHLTHKSPEGLVDFAVRGTKGEQAAIVKAFLDELLSGKYDEEQIQKIWFETPADMYFPKRADLISVLQLMRERLAVG
jgi:hypothetical protein